MSNVCFTLFANCRENERLESETRAKDYLKQEFKQRISREPVKYKLQMSLHVAQLDDPPSILNIARYWNETTHAWLDVAVVTLTTLLSPDVTTGLKFNPGTLPNFVYFLPARSVHDSNCIAHIRKEVYTLTQKIRSDRNTHIQPDDAVTYIIRVQIGNQSGRNFDVSVSLTGICLSRILRQHKSGQDI